MDCILQLGITREFSLVPRSQISQTIIEIKESSGSLHKNNLPDDMRSDFKNKFTKGEQVKVIIVKVTEKGPQLKLVDNKCLCNK